MTKLHYALPGAAFLALAVFWFFVPAQDFTPPRNPGAMIGRPMPNLELPSLYPGASPLKTSALKGRLTLVNIFASWCAACRTEHPLLAALAKKPVVMVGIAYKDKAADARRVLREGGNPFAIVAQDQDGRLQHALGLDGVPETYLIDQQGIIRFRQAGPLTEAAIRDEILPLISKLNRASDPSATAGQ